jgi:hypothetical protein
LDDFPHDVPELLLRQGTTAVDIVPCVIDLRYFPAWLTELRKVRTVPSKPQLQRVFGKNRTCESHDS